MYHQPLSHATIINLRIILQKSNTPWRHDCLEKNLKKNWHPSIPCSFSIPVLCLTLHRKMASLFLHADTRTHVPWVSLYLPKWSINETFTPIDLWTKKMPHSRSTIYAFYPKWNLVHPHIGTFTHQEKGPLLKIFIWITNLDTSLSAHPDK